MSESTHYSPQETEDKWYAHWMKNNYFHSTPDEREAYSIVIPPPNVTGILHMGHMLNNTIQDILIRKARLEGKNACWVPGTDHASIATEAKVVKMLREKGIKKSDITREEFLEYAFQWKDKYGGIILEQLKKLGASCDWERTRFTMEDSMSQAVVRVFVDLHKKGKLYRGLRMTNWDPEALTVLSNEEVIYSDENSHLYHIRYDIEGEPDRHFVIATQRPETIMGDTAVAVHPDDERYKDLIGKNAIIPLIDRPIPIIADTYVDLEFGTGALKVTPAHDQNDNEIGKRHGLEVVDILTADGKLNENAQILVGEDRFVARKMIKKLLKESGHLVELEPYVTSIGRSERTNAVVEPRLTRQWFLDMKDFAKTALGAVESGEVRFFPEHFWNMYNSWLKEDNVRDWCISRQLWWGQRIPAWYYGEEQDEVFVAATAEEALAQARERLNNPDLQISDLKQEEDVVDTWFSSWLWPISVFDGFDKTDELKYYYPTNALVTGWDIMFFWVARMIMVGYEYSEELLGTDHIEKHGRQPFNDVFFTGMVRDFKRRKMSKQLGNSPDALELIKTYGADGVRFGMLSSASAGNDIVFDAPFDPVTKEVINESKLCEQGRNFCNKMWNALNLINGWEATDEEPAAAEKNIQELSIQWLENKYLRTVELVEDHYRTYRLADALKALYSFIWDDFCSWYLEMIKPQRGAPVYRPVLERTRSLYSRMMTLLHPFMPFITEEIWHGLKTREAGDDCVISSYPETTQYNAEVVQLVENAKDVVRKVREIRNTKGIKSAELLPLYGKTTDALSAFLDTPGVEEMITKMARLESLELTSEEIPNTLAFISGTDQYYLNLKQEIDVEAEKAKLTEELNYQKGFLVSVSKKLSNERFVANAPAQVVDKERQKMADAESRIKSLEERLGQL